MSLEFLMWNIMSIMYLRVYYFYQKKKWIFRVGSIWL